MDVVVNGRREWGDVNWGGAAGGVKEGMVGDVRDGGGFPEARPVNSRRACLR